jgi:NhaP-type Na+/H+ or K+/H+ antiporter
MDNLLFTITISVVLGFVLFVVVRLVLRYLSQRKPR